MNQPADCRTGNRAVRPGGRNAADGVTKYNFDGKSDGVKEKIAGLINPRELLQGEKSAWISELRIVAKSRFAKKNDFFIDGFILIVALADRKRNLSTKQLFLTQVRKLTILN